MSFLLPTVRTSSISWNDVARWLTLVLCTVLQRLPDDTDSPFSSSVTPSHSHSRVWTQQFHKFFHRWAAELQHADRSFRVIDFYFSSFSLFSVLVLCYFLRTILVVQVEQSVRCVVWVSECVSERSLLTFDFWRRYVYLSQWFILTLSRLSTKVKVIHRVKWRHISMVAIRLPFCRSRPSCRA